MGTATISETGGDQERETGAAATRSSTPSTSGQSIRANPAAAAVSWARWTTTASA